MLLGKGGVNATSTPQGQQVALASFFGFGVCAVCVVCAECTVFDKDNVPRSQEVNCISVCRCKQVKNWSEGRGAIRDLSEKELQRQSKSRFSQT